jgi:hypothetical protein
VNISELLVDASIRPSVVDWLRYGRCTRRHPLGPRSVRVPDFPSCSDSETDRRPPGGRPVGGYFAMDRDPDRLVPVGGIGGFVSVTGGILSLAGGGIWLPVRVLRWPCETSGHREAGNCGIFGKRHPPRLSTSRIPRTAIRITTPVLQMVSR